MVERFNKTLAEALTMFTRSDQDDWDEYLPYIQYAYNTVKHSVTQETPYFLMYGREACR